MREVEGLGGRAFHWSAWLVRRPEVARRTFTTQGHQTCTGFYDVVKVTSQPVGKRWIMQYIMLGQSASHLEKNEILYPVPLLLKLIPEG